MWCPGTLTISPERLGNHLLHRLICWSAPTPDQPRAHAPPSVGLHDAAAIILADAVGLRPVIALTRQDVAARSVHRSAAVLLTEPHAGARRHTAILGICSVRAAIPLGVGTTAAVLLLGNRTGRPADTETGKLRAACKRPMSAVSPERRRACSAQQE